MDPFTQNGRSDVVILQSFYAIDSNTNLPITARYLLTTDGSGGIIWEDIFTNMSGYSSNTKSGIGYLPSTINSFSNSITSMSTIEGTGFSTLSTSIGYGGIPGSITGPQLFSTTAALGKYGYVTIPSSISTLDGLGTYGYVSTAGLAQTVVKLFNTNYDMSTLMTSTNIGLATFGYVSTSQLTSSLQGLATSGYVSSGHLQSTVLGLSKFNYISTAALTSTFTGSRDRIFLTSQSSLNGLGSLGYVSTQTFLSATQALLRNVNVDRAGNLVVYNANVTVSSLQSMSFFSTFHNSSLTFKGTNGPITASTTGRDLYFSTANLQFTNHSNFITPATKITLDIYPTFLFCYMNLTNTTTIIPFSTFLTYKGSPMLNTTNNSWMVASGFTSGTSNSFQTPLKMSINGANIYGNYDEDYMLTHRLVDALSFNLSGGLTNSNVNIYMASTNSVFVTMQNGSV
jgi:hypothetical protein